MFNKGVPPHESITPRKKKLIAEMEDFQNFQYDFFNKMEVNINVEGETPETEEVNALMELQSDAYIKMWEFIDKL